MALFVLTMVNGPEYDRSRSRREQKEVRRHLGPDPWAPMGVLEIGSIQPWTIWLDSRVPG